LRIKEQKTHPTLQEHDDDDDDDDDDNNNNNKRIQSFMKCTNGVIMSSPRDTAT